MSDQQFEKTLTANDTGHSGGHQAGIHIPKGQADLIAFLPRLDAGVKNPSVWLTAVDEDGVRWEFRYVYYNNSLHEASGTRDEFRITHMTSYFRSAGAEPGDVLIIDGAPGTGTIAIGIRRSDAQEDCAPRSIRLRGWRRVH